MPRVADPRGRDRTRTIQLRGDVADIAQKLADSGTLSSTLSDLLASAYGLGDAIDEHKAALARMVDERQALAAAEETMRAKIDMLEAQAIENETKLLPQLARKHKILSDRLADLSKRHQFLFTPHEKARVAKQIDATENLLAGVEEEMEALK